MMDYKTIFVKLNHNTQEKIKEALGKKSASFVEDDMLVGLGTGSTASYFIKELILRCKEGLNITAVSSSICSLKMAEEGGIPTINMDKVTTIDLTVDGADEVDAKNRLNKGGGGALVREKIIASTSKKMIVIVDESKLSNLLGTAKVPVEILPFGYSATISKLNSRGYFGEIRTKHDNGYFVSDNGNYIFDIHRPNQFSEPEKVHDQILNIPGVVDTRFFFNLPFQVLFGSADGVVAFRK